MILFPFTDFWWFYSLFSVFIIFLLALDLGVFHKEPHEISIKEATISTGVWIGLAFVFNGLLYFYTLKNFSADLAHSIALEFLTGFVVEKTLAIDNVFVFAVVFNFFRIPKKLQHRVLFWGVFGALFFRSVFIAIGSVLMKYEWIIMFFGALLILTGIKMCFAGNEEKDLDKNIFMRLLKRVLKIHPHIEGDKFFIKKEGLLYVTPLFLSLIFLEITDIIFAVDSVPAIFALTKEPLIVFTSNIFAILGLRSMYFMLSGFMDKFVYIKFGLAGVLIFVGSKMVYLNHAFNGKFPISWSLLIIGLIIGISIVVSLIAKPTKNR